MDTSEAAALLTICAAYDNRKPDADTARAWAMALDALRFVDCREAVVIHYRASREWIMPSDVIRGARKIRNGRVLAYGTPPDPPASMSADPKAYVEFLARTTEQIANGEIVRADGDPDQLPRRDVIRELGQAGKAIDARDAIEAARMRLQDTEAERVAERDEKQRRIEEMRAADRNARTDEGTDMSTEDQRAAEGWAS